MEDTLSFAYIQHMHEKTFPVSLELYLGTEDFCRALQISKLEAHYLKYSEFIGMNSSVLLTLPLIPTVTPVGPILELTGYF